MPATRMANPYRPGAGHMPPYLAGREPEILEFQRLLGQHTILENLVLTGLRGVGKTVLLETFKPLALAGGWLWVGTDLSESTSVTEQNLAVRLLTDLSVVTSGIVVRAEERARLGIGRPQVDTFEHNLDFAALADIYKNTPGLTADKLKQVLETVWTHLQKSGRHGVVFAYDEAQNLADHAGKEEYPLSLLLDVFQSIQRKGVPFMLALTGLPTLFPKLVEARTYAERMFHVVSLSALDRRATEQAIREPIRKTRCPIAFADASVDAIVEMTAGYPYFIQYVCRECYDIWTVNIEMGEPPSPVPFKEIIRKLDTDFFSGRWARATDRQRDLLCVIASLENSAGEFTVQETVQQAAKNLEKPFSSSHVSQMLTSLTDAGLIYKNRWGKYSLAVPLLDQFIRRQLARQKSGPE